MEKPIDKGAAQFAADEIQRLEDRIKRLEAAGDDCASLLDAIRPNTAASERWYLAKEAKL
jgi:hypothetical protein